MTTALPVAARLARRWPDYRSVWRWHFYAGLFCIPFVLWLSVTGTIYLFKPQIEAWLDRPYAQLAIDGPAAAPQAQVAAALAVVPGSVLNAYELPASPRAAVRVLVGKGGELWRVYVHPQSLAILHSVREEDRFMRWIFRLHGELMLGDRGSMLVELAASWAVVMLLSGLYLWWPRDRRGMSGIVYPRLHSGRRLFWRDAHAVTGLWVSLFALVLIASGLPWAKSWGGMLKSVRQWNAVTEVKQDWATGRSDERARLVDANTPAVSPVDEHASHAGHEAAGLAKVAGDYSALDRLVPVVSELALPSPVLIAPPSKSAQGWTARSDTANRPQRVNLKLDVASATVTERRGFDDKPLADRVIAVGIAAHEGQLFGWFNQALGLFTTLGLTLVSVSAIVLWWRRRTVGTLGAPKPLPRAPLAVGVFVVMAVLGILLPLLGASMLMVLLVERLVLRRIAACRGFLGLAPVDSR